MRNRRALLTAMANSGPVDTTAPTVTITCDQSSPSSAATFTYTYTWSEDVTGFAVGDAGIANGTKGTFTTVSPSVYTLAVTPLGAGAVTATVAAGVCQDAAGNLNTEATPLSVTATYKGILLNRFGASEVWSLVDIASGTAIPALVASARNGTLTGWDLQNTPGPVAGESAPLSAAGDFATLYTTNGSTGLVDIFNGGVGWVAVWVKVSDGAWVNGVEGRIFYWAVDGSNFVRIRKRTASNQMDWDYRAGGGTVRTVSNNAMGTYTGWFHVCITWDVNAGASGGEMKGYLNGSQVGTTQTTIGTWAGAMVQNTVALLGGQGLASSTPWLGWGAYMCCGFGTALTPTQVLAMYNAVAPQ